MIGWVALLVVSEISRGGVVGATPAERTDAVVDVYENLGFGADHVHQLEQENWTAGESSPEALLKLLYRMRQCDPTLLEKWSSRHFKVRKFITNPAYGSGHLFAIEGRLVRVSAVSLSPDFQKKYGFSEYYRCNVRLGEGLPMVLVIAAQVPRAWQRDAPVSEHVTADGLCVQRNEEGMPVFIARRIAWHPDQDGEPTYLGLTLLGDLGVDVGLGDNVENRQPLVAAEREAFYALLRTAGKVAPELLVEGAQQELSLCESAWRQEETNLATEQHRLEDLSDNSPVGDQIEKKLVANRERLMVVRRLLARAKQGKFSVEPLFNQPDAQWGRLIVLEGIARRALKIHVSADPVKAFQVPDFPDEIDHYFELEIFTDDSQNNPVVFCLRRLPHGFPSGELISEPVRVAGFFFKSWAFSTQQGLRRSGEHGEHRTREYQLAPLLIGSEPLWLTSQPMARISSVGLWIGMGFFLVLLVLWWVLWSFRRGDQQFERQVLAKHRGVHHGTLPDWPEQ